MKRFERTMGFWIKGFLFVGVMGASALVAGCRTEHATPPPNQAAETGKSWREPRKKIDALTGKLVREWTVLREPGKPPVPDGKETTYYLNGAKKSETEYVRGQKIGLRRAWYENGQLYSESTFGDPKVEHPQTFWYPSGQRRMQGPARDGARWGVWHIWYPNGQVAEQGEFKDSLREGPWLTFSEDGHPSGERKYQRNVRVFGPPLSSERSAAALEAALSHNTPEIELEPVEPLDPASRMIDPDPDPDPDRDRHEDGDPIQPH